MTAHPSCHTVKAFDDDVEQLRGTVAEPGGPAEAAYDALYRSSMATMIADPEGSACATNLLFAAQSLAQVAAHSAAIASLVHFAATGERPAQARLAAQHRIHAHG